MKGRNATLPDSSAGPPLLGPPRSFLPLASIDYWCLNSAEAGYSSAIGGCDSDGLDPLYSGQVGMGRGCSAYSRNASATEHSNAIIGGCSLPNHR